MRASVADGSPVLRKMSLTSGPDTRPSMSLSVLLKRSSYFALSAGDTTHCKVVGGKNTSFRVNDETHAKRHFAARAYLGTTFGILVLLKDTLN